MLGFTILAATVLYFLKETDLSVYSQNRLNKVAGQLNERPRKTLEFETPAERVNAVLRRPVEQATA